MDKGKFHSFRRSIIGKKIVSASRKGKYILIELGDGSVMVTHLRMTGALIVNDQLSMINNHSTSPRLRRTRDSKSDLDKHVRHYWILKKGKKKMALLFSDIRKFGTVDLIEDKDEISHGGLCKLGVDPLERSFTVKALEKIIERYPQRKVRQLLLDQCCIAGIGNIYASEILFDAKIHPEKKCSQLSGKNVEYLHKSTQKILKKAIQHRGTSISDYRDSSGNKGGFQNLLNVYNREHEQCPKKGCSGVIQKAKLQGRSAFWCSFCQKTPK